MEQGMLRDELRAHRKLVERWQHAKAQLARLQMLEIRPDDDYNRFLLNKDSRDTPSIAFEVEPTTFLVPERASDFHSLPNLYITVRGRIALNRDAIKHQELKTESFATEVAYFRHNGQDEEGRNILDHIYAAHFDHAVDEVGHPIFHAQMQSYPERVDELTRNYDVDGVVKNHTKGVLKTVRIPTAQMDFFSFLVQVCADHLIHKNSSPEDLEVFEDLRDSTRIIQGSQHLLPELNKVSCTRGVHWYPSRASH